MPSGAVIALAGALIAATTFIAPQAVAATTVAWPQARFDAANTAFNSAETALSPSNVATLTQEWSAPGAWLGTPVVANGVVYTGCEPSSMCALDAATGAVDWQTPMGTSAAPRWETLVGDTVYVGADSPPTEFALNATTGAVLWRTEATTDVVTGSAFTTPPVVAGGLVFQGIDSTVATFVAWNAATGAQQWVDTLDVRGAPATAGGVVFVDAHLNSPTLYALQASTGQILWRSTALAGFAELAPTIAQGLVIIGAAQLNAYQPGTLEAFPVTGCGTAVCTPTWTYQDVRPPTGDDAVANGIIYQGFTDGYLEAIDARTGRPLWKGTTSSAGEAVVPTDLGSPTVANGVVYANGGDGNIYAWAADGCPVGICQPLWTTKMGSGSYSPSDIDVVNGSVYATDDQGTVHAFSTNVAAVPPTRATFTFPLDGSAGVDPTRAFTWTTIPPAQGYIVVVGTRRYGTDVALSGVLPATQLSYLPPQLPAGRTLYASLLTRINGVYSQVQSITFTTGPAMGTFTNPTNGDLNVFQSTQPNDGPLTFTWSTIAAAQAYYLLVGTTVYGDNLVNSGVMPPTQAFYSSPILPTGTILFATLMTEAHGSWVAQLIVFTAAPPVP